MHSPEPCFPAAIDIRHPRVNEAERYEERNRVAVARRRKGHWKTVLSKRSGGRGQTGRPHTQCLSQEVREKRRAFVAPPARACVSPLPPAHHAFPVFSLELYRVASNDLTQEME